MNRLVSLLGGIGLVGLVGCATVEQQTSTSPMSAAVAGNPCVSPDPSYQCMPATAAEIPVGAIWIAEGSCGCWQPDRALAVAP